jgi:ATP-dependent RNA circularization protein (DNA/RNA ligase family)
MNPYHKIQTVFKRDEKGKIIEGDYSIPEFEYLKDNLWIGTEKVDGTNIRVMYKNDELEFGGKTDNAQIPATLYKRLTELFTVEKMREVFPSSTENGITTFPWTCLYGEGYGAKIQKGGGNYKSDGVDFVLFDVKIGNWWLKKEDVADIANQLEIRVVPIVAVGTLSDIIEVTRMGMNSNWGNFIAEGIVATPFVPLFSRNGNRIITKIKHRDFK